MEYTAKLDNWRTDDTHAFLRPGYMMVWGVVEGDKLGRFSDGDYISTSPLPIAVHKEGDLIMTRGGNTYLLGQPMPIH